MSSKKKFVISLSVVSVIALTAIIALVSVLATFNASTESGFNISYTAENVNARISAEYKINNEDYTTIQTEDNLDLITFSTADEDESTTKSFKSITINDMKKDDVIIIHYTITNTDTTGVTFKVVGASAFTKNSNLTIKYAGSEDAETWGDSITDIANSDKVENGTPLNVYVKISITVKTTDANLQGSFSFNLTVNE